jgi:hypothetical protein
VYGQRCSWLVGVGMCLPLLFRVLSKVYFTILSLCGQQPSIDGRRTGFGKLSVWMSKVVVSPLSIKNFGARLSRDNDETQQAVGMTSSWKLLWRRCWGALLTAQGSRILFLREILACQPSSPHCASNQSRVLVVLMDLILLLALPHYHHCVIGV